VLGEEPSPADSDDKGMADVEVDSDAEDGLTIWSNGVIYETGSGMTKFYEELEIEDKGWDE
jgi:hypothetical protein